MAGAVEADWCGSGEDVENRGVGCQHANEVNEEEEGERLIPIPAPRAELKVERKKKRDAVGRKKLNSTKSGRQVVERSCRGCLWKKVRSKSIASSKGRCWREMKKEVKGE